MRILGNKAAALFANEAGGHRWQRIPETDKRGRVHSSTVTVAVLVEPTPIQLVLNDKDLDIRTCRGSGAGGQHRNKTESAIQITHIPTGTTAHCENERSQAQNKATALGLLRARLWAAQHAAATARHANERKGQVGSGMRGDKRRTVRCQDNQVNDHVTGQFWTYKEYQRGQW